MQQPDFDGRFLLRFAIRFVLLVEQPDFVRRLPPYHSVMGLDGRLISAKANSFSWSSFFIWALYSVIVVGEPTGDGLRRDG